MKQIKKNFDQIAEELKVKEIIKDSKAKGMIKPLKEAFKENPTKIEAHKGDLNYF